MKAKLVRLENQQEIAKAELEKPFVLDDELITKEARLTELNSQLSLDGEEEVEESAENKEHAKTEEASTIISWMMILNMMIDMRASVMNCLIMMKVLPFSYLHVDNFF